MGAAEKTAQKNKAKKWGNRRAEPKGSSIRLEQRVCYGWVFMEHGGEEMKPRCLQGPREVMQSDLHWKLLPAMGVYRLEERPSADT